MCKMLRYSIVLVALLASYVVLAHPEDDFCTPGDDSMDPALCAALAELNSEEGSVRSSDMPTVLNELGEERSIGSTAALYISIGVRHILPDGLDHILFVLAIFLASVRFRALPGSALIGLLGFWWTAVRFIP